jgi:hypothetical protein
MPALLRKYRRRSGEPPNEMNPLIPKLMNVAGEFRRVAAMNAPVPVPRPEEVSDATRDPTVAAPEHHLGWPSILLLISAALVTLLWNAALVWLAGRAFGLW